VSWKADKDAKAFAAAVKKRFRGKPGGRRGYCERRRYPSDLHEGGKRIGVEVSRPWPILDLDFPGRS